MDAHELRHSTGLAPIPFAVTREFLQTSSTYKRIDTSLVPEAPSGARVPYTRSIVLNFRGTDALMMLNKDLIREILLAVEADAEPEGLIVLEMNNFSAKMISYHVRWLDEAGLLDALDTGGMNYFKWQPTRLTYEGHEFVNIIRDDEIWELIKTGAEKVSSTSLDLMLELGKIYSKQVLKVRIGIELQ